MLRAEWPSPPNVHAFTTLRHGAGDSQPPFDRCNLGLRSGDDPATVQRNRQALVQWAGLPAMPCWLRQVHGIDVVRFGAGPATHDEALIPQQESDSPTPSKPLSRMRQRGWGEGRPESSCPTASKPLSRVRGEGARLARDSRACTRTPVPLAPAGARSGGWDEGSPESSCKPLSRLRERGWGEGRPELQADAAVTAAPGTVLAVLTADCLPVVLAATDGAEVAVAHAGWRGLSAGVVEQTVAAMQASPADLVAWLGPAAGPETYEVGVEVHRAFMADDAGAGAAFVPTRPGHWRVDLYALARRRLQAAGVNRVHGGNLCTIGDAARFYSHRRDQRTGRMATVVWFDAPA